MTKPINLIEKYFAINDLIQPVSNFSYSYTSTAKILYEVIRVKNSIPIFLEFHLDRLFKSINLMGVIAPKKNTIKAMIVELLRINPIEENNFRISLVYDLSTKPDLLIYFIHSSYPSENHKANGIVVKTLKAYRDNPNIKIENSDLREKADRIISKTGCYEVLLANNDGYITEGSRSNVFFVKGDTIITPPIEKVLGGITRQILLTISKDLRIPVIEKLIAIDNLSTFDGAAITGTSPGILPIASIDNLNFNVKLPLIHSLIDRYNNAIETDILTYKVK